MKKLSIILSIAILAIMIFANCNNQKGGNEKTSENESIISPPTEEELSNPIEIKKHGLLVYPVPNVNKGISYKNNLLKGSHLTYTGYYGEKRINFRETYNLDEYKDKSIYVGEDKSIGAFDIFELQLLQRNSYKYVEHIKGAAFKKANGKILVVLFSEYTPFETMRLRFVMTNMFDETEIRYINDVPMVVVGSCFDDFNIIQSFLIPLHKPTNNVDPVKENNFAQFVYPEGKGIKPQKDSLVIVKCYGGKPQIDCFPDGKGGSDIIIRAAKPDGSDITMHIDKAIYNYDGKALYDIKKERFIDKSTMAGASFGLSNGRYLNILQAKEIKKYTEYYKEFKVIIDKDNPYGDEFVNWLSIYNRNQDFIMFPRYIPVFP